VDYLVAGFLGYVAGILNGYTWNRLWTFETGPFAAGEFSRYVFVQSSGALANVGGLALAVEVAGMNKLAAEVVVLAPIVLATYLMNRNWTFRTR
jgi:putative flippase GtrA